MNIKIVLAAFLGVMLVSVSAYAMGEAAAVPATGKTLADFNYEQGGTKAVVAFHKYQDWLSLSAAPRPSLGVSQMRVSAADKTVMDYMQGTKPSVALTRFEEAKRLVSGVPSRPGVSDGTTGTKPVIAALR